MNNEIKEILDSIQEHLKEKEENFKKGAVDSTVYYLYCDNARTLLDYITNLQEENERLKEVVENLTTMTVCGDRKQIKNTAQYKLEQAQSRIDKAIKLIKEAGCYDEETKTFCNDIWDELPDLLNILQGEDYE